MPLTGGVSTFATPRLHDDLPGIGGALKERAEDFEVDEIPAYEPAGEGDHLFLRVEKRDVSAEELLRHVRRTLDLSDRDVGCAGLKDRRAVTRQWLSIPATAAGKLADLETDAIQVLETARHRNKLRTGHLRGNRFRLVVRGVSDAALAGAQQLCERIRDRGAPNAYGDQRFGAEGGNVVAGLALLGAGDPGETSGRRKRPGPRRRRFLLSAVQSALFNRYLAARLADDLMHELIEGEVVQVVGSHTCRRSEDLAADRQRFTQRDIVPAGPIFGGRMVAAAAVAAIREGEVLSSARLTTDSFASQRKHARGSRRAILVWPRDLAVEVGSDGLVFKFELPAGSYATIVMREIMGG